MINDILNNLRQETCNSKSTANTISLNDALDVCNDFLVSIKGTLTNDDLIILDMQPMYKPQSNIANFYEFKVGTEENNNNGYVIVGMTFEEYPITEFSLKGDSYYNEFKKRTGIENIKVFRFGDGFYACEDIDGKLLDLMGIIPSYGINNASSFSESTPSETNESPNIQCLISYTNCLNQTDQKFDYIDLKKNFIGFKKSKAEQEFLLKLWDFTLTTQVIDNKSILSESGTSLQVSPIIKNNGDVNDGEYYDFRLANGSNNQSYFTQLAPGESPNTTDHYSGCGATAWINLLGWHDLNFTPGLLRGEHRKNDSYTKALTMQLHNYLGTTSIITDDGITWPWNIKNGINFVREELEFTTNGYWIRWRTGINPLEWFGYHDGYWIFDVVQEYIENKKLPVIVGYFQDWHYCIAYGTMKQKRTTLFPGPFGFIQYEQAWIQINRGWGPQDYDKNNAFITPSGLFASVGIDEFKPLLSLDNLLEQPEFEVDLSRSYLLIPSAVPVEEIITRRIKTNKMLVYNGIAVLDSNGAFDEGIFRTTVSFLVGRVFNDEEDIQIIAKASLASISDNDHSVGSLYAVDSVTAYRDKNTGRIKVNVRIGLRDIDAFLHRISYQVIVLIKE